MLGFAVLCYAAHRLWYALLCFVMLCCGWLYFPVLCSALLCMVLFDCASLCLAVPKLYFAILSPAVLGHALLCYDLLWFIYALPCYDWPCFDLHCWAVLWQYYSMLGWPLLCLLMLCYASLGYATLRYAMLCPASPRQNWSRSVKVTQDIPNQDTSNQITLDQPAKPKMWKSAPNSFSSIFNQNYT